MRGIVEGRKEASFVDHGCGRMYLAEVYVEASSLSL